MVYLTKGILLGLSIAAPVGPIGVLCIRRTLANGLSSGISSGLGSALADGFYGFVAAFGLTIITSLLLDNRIYLQLIGGLFLLYLGCKTFISIPSEHSPASANRGLAGDCLSSFFLTISNPITIIFLYGNLCRLRLWLY